MSDRAGVNFISQFGIESTPGTAVNASRFCPTLSWMLAREVVDKKFRAAGNKVPGTHVVHKRMARGSVEGILDYNSCMYIFDGIFSAATPVQIGALTAYTREWLAGVRTADTCRNYTVEQGDSVACEDYAFTQLLGFELDSGQDDFSIKSGAISRYPADNQTLTSGGSITTVPERPVERNDVNVYLNDTYGAIGTTKVTQALDENISLGDKFKEFFVHNSATPEFADIIEIPYEPTFKFATVHNAASRTLINSLLTNPTKWMRWEAIGASLGTHSAIERFETIWIDMCVKFGTPEIIRADDQPLGYRYNCSLIPDMAGLGSFMKITSINSIATA